MRAPAPAPASTTTSTPERPRRPTTSGTMATRFSPEAVSLGTPSFIGRLQRCRSADCLRRLADGQDDLASDAPVLDRPECARCIVKRVLRSHRDPDLSLRVEVEQFDLCSQEAVGLALSVVAAL